MNNSNKLKKEALFLSGTKIGIRPVIESDIDSIWLWWNDSDVTRYMFTGQRPTTVEQVRNQVESDVASPHSDVFMLVDLASGEGIGLVGLYQQQTTARKAELRIIIGEKDSWGQGYGTEATKLITFYGFDRLNLNRIYLGVTSENGGANRAYEKAGYVQEGVLKEDIYRNGEYYNTIRLGLLRSEYLEKHYREDVEVFTLNK